MKKIGLLILVLSVFACSMPRTPTDADLLSASTQFREELFESGARGQVILGMSDNISSTGFFSTNYEDVVEIKNIKTGEVYYMRTKLNRNAYDTIMLPVGDYLITNLYLEYTYTTSTQVGNQRIVEYHVKRLEHFEGKNKLTFSVKSKEVVYLGNIKLIKLDNKQDTKDKFAGMYKLENNSTSVPEKQKKKWKKTFGKDYSVRLIGVK